MLGGLKWDGGLGDYLMRLALFCYTLLPIYVPVCECCGIYSLGLIKGFVADWCGVKWEVVLAKVWTCFLFRKFINLKLK
jgi:hypothetical protein